MVNKTVKRRRDKAVTIRMTNEEFAVLQERAEDSGLTQQAYILTAIRGATITSSDEISVLKDISKTFSELVKQLRDLSTNVKQVAQVANVQGMLPTTTQLIKTSDEISQYRKESDELWLSIRSLINQQNHTEQ